MHLFITGMKFEHEQVASMTTMHAVKDIYNEGMCMYVLNSYSCLELKYQMSKHKQLS